MKKILLLCSVIQIVWCTSQQEAILQQLTKDDFITNIPQEDPWSALEVKAQLLVLSMKSQKGVKLFNHINIDMLIQQTWKDFRLVHNGSSFITLGGEFVEQFWRPDTRILGLKKGFSSEITKPNILLHIYPNGTVVSSQRCRMVNFCLMDYTLFPFDTQICDLILESFSFSNAYMKLSWMTNNPRENFRVMRDPQIEEFVLHSFYPYNTTFHYSGNGSGTHDHLIVRIRLTRPKIFYLFRMYLPLLIVVLISWTSFWVDYRSLSARVTLGTTTVLTIVQLRLKIYEGDAPSGQTLNLYDFYSIICFIFVFAALIEYSIAQSMDIKYRLRDWYNATQKLNPDEDVDYEDTVEQNKATIASDFTCDAQPTKNFSGFLKFSLEYIDYKHSLTRHKYHALDKISQYIFPIMFFLINVVYVCIVIYYQKKNEENLEKFTTWEITKEQSMF